MSRDQSDSATAMDSTFAECMRRADAVHGARLAAPEPAATIDKTFAECMRAADALHSIVEQRADSVLADHDIFAECMRKADALHATRLSFPEDGLPPLGQPLKRIDGDLGYYDDKQNFHYCVGLPSSFTDQPSDVGPPGRTAWELEATPLRVLATLVKLYQQEHDLEVTGEVFVGLPQGYQSYQKVRRNGKLKGSLDRRIMGHPSGRYFDSIVQFWEHFRWLMDEKRDDRKCDCALCERVKVVYG